MVHLYLEKNSIMTNIYETKSYGALWQYKLEAIGILAASKLNFQNDQTGMNFFMDSLGSIVTIF